MKGLLVFFGGGLGALTRYFLYHILPKETFMPYGTLIANFFGCFIATVVFSLLILKSDTDSIYKLLLITGFCGGLSTLSALSLEVLSFIQADDYTRTTIYVLSTVIVCTIAVLLGVFIAKNCLN